MLIENTVVVLGIAAFLAILTVLMFFVARRADIAVSNAPLIEELKVLEARIAERRRELTDTDSHLDKLRESLANFAERQADVEALVRKRDELLAEWNNLEERRGEVREIKAQTEQAMLDKQALDATLAEEQGKLESVQDRLERADQLVGRIAELESQQVGLDAKVAGLRDEAQRLEEAQARIAALEKREHEQLASLAQLDGQTEARRAELAEAEAKAVAARAGLAEALAAQVEVAGTLAAARLSRDDIVVDVQRIDERRADLQARLAHLEEQVTTARANANASTGETDNTTTVEDRLRELNVRPPVLIELGARPIWQPADEADALHQVSHRMETLGLVYPKRVLRAFHTAMKVNETAQIAVLAGISGTGKSQLPRQYAAGMGIGFLHVPVQPRWDSPQDLMGFYNYIEGRFRPTDMARALWQLDTLNNLDGAIPDRMMMILLDEMNLARVEYYFSDFLSRLESRPAPGRVDDSALRKDAEIELEIPMPAGVRTPRVFPGYNLLFAGTMNEDESTQSLSDKVVDRANVLRFAAPRIIRGGGETGGVVEVHALPQSRWASWVRDARSADGERRVTEALDKMAEVMRAFQRPFGHRLGRGIMAYVANYPDVEGSDRLTDALADQVEMRLLPKLRGIEIDQADVVFSDLQTLVERDIGDASLAEAIGDSVATARDGSGQFVWNGIVR